MKKLLIPLLVIGVIAAGVGYYMYNKPVESLERKKAEVSVTANQIIADYEADEKAANDKYLGKVVEVTGRVSTITDEGGKIKVQLETENPMSLVICELEDGKDAGQIQVGEQAKVKGLCSGYLSDVVMVQSTIEKI
ncbi:MAG: hypothetical protein ABIQ11_05970 [Saprospiraceae bacterium]